MCVGGGKGSREKCKIFHGRFRRGKRDAINDFSAQKSPMISQPRADPSHTAERRDGGFFGVFLRGEGSVLVARIALLMLRKAPASGCPAESSCKVSSPVP